MQDNNNSGEIAPEYGGSTIGATVDAPITTDVDQPAPEAAPEPAPVVSEQEQKFAAKFAALSRKEKAIRQQEAKLQQQMTEMQAKIAAMEEQSKAVEGYKNIGSRLKREPMKVWEEHGLTREQLAEIVLNDGALPQDVIMSEYEQKFLSKVEALEARLAAKELEEAQAKEAQVVEQFTAQLTDFVNKTENYELIRANDAVDTVLQVIKQHHDETGEILSNEEACNAVEDYLLEQAKKLVDREKVKKLLQPQVPPPAKSAPKGSASPTLSNAQAATASKGAAPLLDNEKSKEEAAKLLRWQD